MRTKHNGFKAFQQIVASMPADLPPAAAKQFSDCIGSDWDGAAGSMLDAALWSIWDGKLDHRRKLDVLRFAAAKAKT